MQEKYLSVLLKDQILSGIISTIQIEPLRKKTPIHMALVRSIVSQQLSTKVAQVIYTRVINLLMHEGLHLSDFDSISVENLRGVGLSQSKANYILNVIAFFKENKLNDKVLFQKSDEELSVLFTSIKGIGKWSVQMILMFAMQRENVFPEDDLGIQESMKKLYQIKTENKKELKQKMQQIAKAWEPYRTYACIYLWRYKDVASTSTKKQSE